MFNTATIYVVDRDATGRQLIANTLRKSGYSVDEWHSLGEVEGTSHCDLLIFDPVIEGTIAIQSVNDVRLNNDFVNSGLSCARLRTATSSSSTVSTLEPTISSPSRCRPQPLCPVCGRCCGASPIV